MFVRVIPLCVCFFM